MTAHMDRFQNCWNILHEDSSPRIPWIFVKSDLMGRYSAGNRFYHNIVHINEGLKEIDSIKHLLNEPEEVEVAWNFHDSIYIPIRKDNEEKSKFHFRHIAIQSGIPEKRISRIESHIDATKHTYIPELKDSRYLIDIDLSILGKDEKTFKEYEENIKKEYSIFPENQFKIGRKAILEYFLKRPSIYLTEYFQNKYENKAKSNLQRSLDNLF